MWRLPLHPIFRFLLPVTLLVWLYLVAANPAAHLRGIVVRYTGEQIGLPTKSAPAPKSEKIYFYISTDGSIDAFGTETLTNDFWLLGYRLLATNTYVHSSREHFGLIYAPIRSNTKHSTVTWSKNIIQPNPYTTDDLEAALTPFRDVWQEIGLSNDDIFYLHEHKLGDSSILGLRLPLVQPRNTSWSINLKQAAYELAYYAAFAWWLLTLMYARKLSPKRDNTRCPNCSYPTTGLTTQICPECGNTIEPQAVS